MHQSKEFTEIIQKLKEKDRVFDSSEFAMKILDMNTANAYTYPGASNTFVSGSFHPYNSDCTGKTSCYNQFTQYYNGQYCYSGCSPTSVAIIYAYHDRNGYPNLYPNVTAPLENTTQINDVVNILRTQMGTSCEASQGNIYA